MKTVIYQFASIALFTAIITLDSCREQDVAKTEEEVQLDKLHGSWTMTNAVNGGIERSNEFVNMKITFSGTYTPEGVYSIVTKADDMPDDSPWNANEMWRFNTSYVQGMINLQTDLRIIRYGFLDPYGSLATDYRHLLLEFDGTETDPGDGHWQFFFSKELPD